MKKIFSKIIRYIGYILFRPIWWLECFVPRSKNIWVFGAWFGQKYSDNSKWLYEYVLNHEPNIKAIWITKNRDVYKRIRLQNKPVYMNISVIGVLCCLRAKYVVLSSTQDDVNKYFINGAKQIWLWHGMPLKKIGYCDELVKESFFCKIFNPYSKVKPYATLTSADFFIPFLQDAFLLQKDRIWKTGLPRCDAFFCETNDSLVDNLKKKFRGSRILLYMPTFRMLATMNGKPFSPFIEDFGFDEKEFNDFLERQNLVFLYKPHYVDSSVKINISSRRFMCIGDSDFEDLYILLNNIDVLLTDYSSVYFDFLASKKHSFLLTFDYDEYIKNSRAHFFNMYNEMHASFCKNWQELYEKFRYLNLNSKGFIKDDNEKFAHYLDGNSCKMVADKIMNIK